MKKALVLVVFMAIGCSSQDEAPELTTDGNPSLKVFEFNFDVETDDGMLIETRGHDIPASEDLDTWYAETQQCVSDWWASNITARPFEEVMPSPVVIDNDTSIFCETANGTGATGIYCTSYAVPFIALQAEWARYDYQWKHEFIHHILASNDVGANDPLNKNHQSDDDTIDSDGLWACDGVDSPGF